VNRRNDVSGAVTVPSVVLRSSKNSVRVPTALSHTTLEPRPNVIFRRSPWLGGQRNTPEKEEMDGMSTCSRLAAATSLMHMHVVSAAPVCSPKNYEQGARPSDEELQTVISLAPAAFGRSLGMLCRPFASCHLAEDDDVTAPLWASVSTPTG